MSRNKPVVCCFTILLLIAAIFIWCAEYTEVQITPFQASVPCAQAEEEILPWQNPDGNFYLFLPSYAQHSQILLYPSENFRIFINSTEMTPGMTCSGFLPRVAYDLQIHAGKEVIHSTITFLYSDAVSTMYLDTESGTMDYIHEKKGAKESAQVRLYTSSGELNFQGAAASVEGRGNSSWSPEKKPYNITLENEADLLDMGLGQRWILLANHLDPTGLKNKLTYDFAQDIGMPYTPQTRWVDLFLNGEYAGLYLLSERNEAHPNRVPLTAPDAFLISMELGSRAKVSDYLFLTTESGQYLRVHHHNSEIDRVEEIIASMERAILSDSGVDPVTGKHWQDMIDMDSWVFKYLLEEVFANIESGAISQFFYYGVSEGDTKVYAGPVWDYDITMSTVDPPDIFYVNRTSIEKPEYTSWFHGLYQKEVFRTQVIENYKTLFRPLVESLFVSGIDQYVNEISSAMELNQIRYGSSSETWINEVNAIREFMFWRLHFLDAVWIAEIPHSVVTLQVQGHHPVHFPVLPGEAFGMPPEYLNTNRIRYGWWYEEKTGLPLDPEKPVYEDTTYVLSQEETLLSKLVNHLFPCVLGALFAGFLIAEGVRRRRWSKKKTNSVTSSNI